MWRCCSAMSSASPPIPKNILRRPSLPSWRRWSTGLRRLRRGTVSKRSRLWAMPLWQRQTCCRRSTNRCRARSPARSTWWRLLRRFAPIGRCASASTSGRSRPASWASGSSSSMSGATRSTPQRGSRNMAGRAASMSAAAADCNCAIGCGVARWGLSISRARKKSRWSSASGSANDGYQVRKRIVACNAEAGRHARRHAHGSQGEGLPHSSKCSPSVPRGEPTLPLDGGGPGWGWCRDRSMVKKTPSAGAGARARTLRREMTVAEKRLWQILRSRQTEGYRFRRQVPIGGFIADFVCHEARLIVEIDGGQHDPSSGAEASRARFLEAEGYRVLRFWNNEVLDNPEGVRAAIAESLQRVTPTGIEPLTPTPTLPHRGGGYQ